jgi:hypothetical protein
MGECAQQLLAELAERLLDYCPHLAVQILAHVEQKYFLVAKTANDTIELWCIPLAWARDGALPIGYQSVTMQWIVCPKVECFIAPPFEPEKAISMVQKVFKIATLEGGLGERRRSEVVPSGASLDRYQFPTVMTYTFTWGKTK